MIQNDERIQSIFNNIIDKVQTVKNDFNTNGQSHYDYMLEKLKSAQWDLNLLVSLAEKEKKENE